MRARHARVAVKACAAFVAVLFVCRVDRATAVDVAPVHAPLKQPSQCDEPVLQGYEPNVLGLTKQGDDVPFFDFTVSIKIPLLRGLLCKRLNLQGRDRLYVTFTGRFGFYRGTRYSDPVIAKNYNPKLIWRVIPDDGARTVSASTLDRRVIEEYSEYFDFAYAHDSNGQGIDTPEAFAAQADHLGNANYALDYVSRGWDYLGFTFKKTVRALGSARGYLGIYPDFKFFLRHGLLQGAPEEYHSWEQDSTLLPRHAFDGLAITLDYHPFAPTQLKPRERAPLSSSLRFGIRYMTGYDPVARYNTIRGEVGLAPFGLPLALWIQDGYMNSLARYYKKTSAVGIEIRLLDSG